MKLFKTKQGNVVEHGNQYYRIALPWDELINRDGLHHYLQTHVQHAELLSPAQAGALLNSQLEAPIGAQEVWAAGVTYLRSRDARMEESKESGGASFYDKVYEAERPELFFKAQPHRVAAQDEHVYIRRDS